MENLAVEGSETTPEDEVQRASLQEGDSHMLTTFFLRPLYEDLVALCLFVALGALLRLDFVVARHLTIDSDEAIVGLMAKHIMEGRALPTFYYGQHYMGSLEPLMAAMAFALFGVSAAALIAVPLLWSIFLLPLTYLLGYHLAPERKKLAARVSTLFISVGPAPLLVWSAKARGGFIEVVCLGVIAFLLTLFWLREGKQSRPLTVAIGIVLGLGWWTNNQILFFMLPIGAMFLSFLVRSGDVRPVLYHLVTGLLGFLIGGAPFWIYNLRNKWQSFGIFQGADGNFFAHLHGFFVTAAPIIFGAKRFWSDTEVVAGSSLLLLGLTLVTLWLLRNVFVLGVVMFCGGEWQERGESVLLVLFLLTCGVVFSASSFGSLSQAPRYLLPLYPAIAALLGIAVSISRGVTASVVVLGFFLLNLASSFYGGRAIPGEPFVFRQERVMRDHTALIEWLEEHDVSWVWTNYWIGYRLAFETEERVKFRVFGFPSQRRVPQWEIEGGRVPPPKMPLVLTKGQAKVIGLGLKQTGASFKREDIGDYSILYELELPDRTLFDEVASTRFSLSTSHGSQPADAVDGQLSTRWGSGAPQSVGMRLRVTFPGESLQSIKALEIADGTWGKTDRGEAVRIVCAKDLGEEVLVTPLQYKALDLTLNSFGGERPLFFVFQSEVLCRELSLELTEGKPIFDWSIAELSIYE